MGMGLLAVQVWFYMPIYDYCNVVGREFVEESPGYKPEMK